MIFKVFKAASISLGGLILLLLLFSLFLSNKFEVKREIIIFAPTDSIEVNVLKLENWEKWTVWTRKSDSTAIFTYFPANKNKFAKMKWKGDQLGKGKIEIIKYIPNKLIVSRLNFGENFESINKMMFEKESELKTKVIWIESGELGWNPFSKIMGLAMDKFMGSDLESGLNKLKIISEN